MNANKMKKIIYSILKEITEGDKVPLHSDYEITHDEFLQIVRLMCNEGYLNKKWVIFDILGNVSIIKQLDLVTMKGIEFLEENNKWNKLYKGLKEFRDFLPL